MCNSSKQTLHLLRLLLLLAVFFLGGIPRAAAQCPSGATSCSVPPPSNPTLCRLPSAANSPECRCFNAQPTSGVKCFTSMVPFDPACRLDQFCRSSTDPSLIAACGSAVGTCTAYGTLQSGATCTATPQCAFGLYCAAGRCAAYADATAGKSGVNQSCRISTDCASGLRCRAGLCSSGAAGESCRVSWPDCQRGLRCRGNQCRR